MTTVSRTLGGHGDVAEAARLRVQAEADRIGYRANVSTPRLKGGVSDAVAVILPTGPGQLEDAFFLLLLSRLPTARCKACNTILSHYLGGGRRLARRRRWGGGRGRGIRGRWGVHGARG
ncbi:LacI family DNA-binding transcriptional regulator [Roseomonas gilardii]|uniref:LacI family DNA-binding transcriptional regulator n=1 Tax=Roseomonas gilardii TaxID=257708 RepID=UPI001643CBB0|nr:LacI family DNA-binding transcriptional regulator [Roseomonas gilardii]